MYGGAELYERHHIQAQQPLQDQVNLRMLSIWPSEEWGSAHLTAISHMHVITGTIWAWLDRNAAALQGSHMLSLVIGHQAHNNRASIWLQ